MAYLLLEVVCIFINYIVGTINAGLLKIINAIVSAAQEDLIKDIANNWISLDSSKYTGLMTTAESVFNLLAPIGCGLVIVFFFLELINQLAKDNLSGYTLLKSGVQLIFAFGIVTMGFTFCKTICEIGTWFALKVPGGGGTDGKDAMQLVKPNIKSFLIGNSILNIDIPDDVSNIGFGDLILKLTSVPASDSGDNGFLDVITKIATIVVGQVSMAGEQLTLFVMCFLGVLLAIIYWLALQIIKLILVMQCVSRAIQVAIYSAMSPIGIAAWFSGGSITTSTAMRYTKKLLALSIQGGIMCLIMALAFAIDAGSDSLFLTLVGPLTAVGLFGKSNQIANDVCGT